MSRPDVPISPDSPYADLAARLRELRISSGQSYRTLSQNTNYSKSTLAAAAAGNRLPSMEVVLAFARSCGGDELELRTLWNKARREAPGRREDPISPPAPPEPPGSSDLALVATPTDLTAVLNRLWTASGRTPIRRLQASSGGALRKTTIHDVLTGARVKPEWNTIWELVRVLHGQAGDPDKAAWRAAWKRARAWADAENGRLPARTPVHSCDPVALGVHPGLGEADHQTPYIARDIDGDVRAAISAAGKKGGFILLVGEEGSGKTRLAYEALRAEVPEFGLFSPASEGDFSRPLPPRTVVWLDNIDQHLDWASLTPLAIQVMQNAADPVIVVGTMCARRYNGTVALPDSAQRKEQQRHQEVLNQASVFSLPVRLSTAELDRAKKKDADPQIAVALKVADSELFRTLASGPHLARRWATADRYARAVITAAADTQQVGITGSLPRHLLREAAVCYLSPRYREQAAHGWFDEALAYATARVPGGLAPLMPDRPGTGQRGAPAYRAAGYLLWLRKSQEHQELPATAELIDDLTALNFADPAYFTFEGDLARYAADVLSRGPRTVSKPSNGPYTGRHRSPEHHYALKLAMETVDEVLPYFRHELAEGSWKQDTGKSLAAWFIDMCRTALDNGSSQSADPDPPPEDLAAGTPPSSTGSAVIRIILGTHLRREREDAGITCAKAAKEIGIQESGLGHIELGRSSVRVDDVLTLLTLYRVDAYKEENLLALAEQADRPGWWHRYHDILPEWFHAYAAMEKVARSIRLYEQQFIPGLLQTEEYASSVISLCDYPPEDARRHVEFRGERQQRFQDQKLTLWAVLDEAALRRMVAGVEVQIQQLKHLRKLLDTQPNLTLQIIPQGTRSYPVPASFSMLRFAEPYLSDVVYTENLTSALYIDNQAETDHYLNALERLTEVASKHQRTISILEQAIEDMEGQNRE